ncbi:hypothetical protein [Haloarcula amylovorans]|uniref:hypothetical protein n=1 Tax=Haloarcula amylovorans TaxID=2562280 RepID=UPI0010762638|nr:hypothetical protein [Halomicroarcula amylolytica]
MPISSEEMDEVADGLFVRPVKNAGDEALIREHSIVIIVSLIHSEPDGRFSSDLPVENIPMIDGPRNEQQRFD